MIICAGGLAHRKATHGIIHFAPAVIMEQFDRGFDALQMFARLEGVNGDTIVRGFCTCRNKGWAICCIPPLRYRF